MSKIQQPFNLARDSVSDIIQSRKRKRDDEDEDEQRNVNNAVELSLNTPTK